MRKKYESKLDDLVDKLSNAQNQFEIEIKTNKTRIEEYIKTIQQKNEYCLNLEKNVNELNQKLSTKQCEYNDLYFGMKEKEKQLNALKLELNNSCSNNIQTENVLSIKDNKIEKLEKDLQEMHQMQYRINNEKQQLNEKLIHSNQENEKLNNKLQIISNQLINSQQNKSEIIGQLTANNENLKNENESLKKQNQEIRNVTKDMKSAISQLHELSAIDKKQNGMDYNEMQSLIQENEKLKQQLNSTKSKLKEKERELQMIKRERTRLNEISNRYHHELNMRDFNNKYEQSENYYDCVDDQDDDSMNNTKVQNEQLMKKIKQLQSSLTKSVEISSGNNRMMMKSSGTRSRSNSSISNTMSIPPPSKHSIRSKYDEVRRKLHSGTNDNRSKSRYQHPARNWNQR